MSLPAIPAAVLTTPAPPAATMAAPYIASGTGYVYDDHGNRIGSGMTDSAGNGFKFKYTDDAWNRLVELRRARVMQAQPDPAESAYDAIGVYPYNARNWRTGKLTVGGSEGDGVIVRPSKPPGDPSRWERVRRGHFSSAKLLWSGMGFGGRVRIVRRCWCAGRGH